MALNDVIKKVELSIKKFNDIIMRNALKTKENNDYALSLGYTVEHNQRMGYSYRKKKEGRELIIWSTREGFVAAELFSNDSIFRNHKNYKYLRNALKNNC